MFVFFDGKGFVGTLIEVAMADTFVCDSSLSYMRRRDPAHEFAEVFVIDRIEYEVPVVGHDDVREDTHTGESDTFKEE